jgi:hypothetical protein
MLRKLYLGSKRPVCFQRIFFVGFSFTLTLEATCARDDRATTFQRAWCAWGRLISHPGSRCTCHSRQVSLRSFVRHPRIGGGEGGGSSFPSGEAVYALGTAFRSF